MLRAALLLLHAVACKGLRPQLAASVDLRGSSGSSLTRRALLGVLGAGAGCFGSKPAWAEDAGEEVIKGVLQLEKGAKIATPSGTKAVVTLRVVGRNLKGPMATVEVPIGEASFPFEFTVSRADLREGLPDYIWKDDDIYLKADVLSPSGKVAAVGRSKAKAVTVDGVAVHLPAYVTLE